MGLFRCVNPQCGKWPKGFVFEDNDPPVCPKCGKKNVPGQPGPHIQELVAIHLVVMDDDKGVIFSTHGMQYVACQPKRDGLALHSLDKFCASPDPRNTTCPSCKGTPIYKALAACYPEIAKEAAVEAAIAEIAARSA